MNELCPELGSVGVQLNEDVKGIAGGRKYMCGSYIPKACKIEGLTTRRVVSLNEREYGRRVRNIVAPANMVIEKIIYRRSLTTDDNLLDDWEEINVIFFNEDLKKYDLLVLPKHHTQNFEVGFEYIYDKEVMSRLEPGATFSRGEVFALTPGMSDTGEWMFGRDVKVVPMTKPSGEEDGIEVVETLLEKMAVMFEHKRSHSWNDTEYIPVNLYGDLNSYCPFPQNGQKIRDDGLVMAFRRRDSKSAMASLTNKALLNVDLLFDVKIYGPPNGIVKSVIVKSERLKDRSFNRNPRPIMKHTELLESYAEADNMMYNEIKSWYVKTSAKYDKKDELPFTKELLTLCLQSYGNITTDYISSKPKPVLIQRSNRNKILNNWNINLLIKERVPAKIRFKMSDPSGAKSVIVGVIKKEHAPFDENGQTADVVANNTPAFRRQIFTALVYQSVNFINLYVHRKITELVKKKGGYALAWDELIKFYKSVAPEFAETVMEVYPDKLQQLDHVQYVLEREISVPGGAESKVYCANIIRNIMKEYSKVKPGKITYFNELGQPVTTMNDIGITVVHYMLLNKFGTDLSSESFSKNNLFGFPSKLNQNDKYGKWYRAVADRNSGVTEMRIEISQSGGEEAVRQLVLPYSPLAKSKAIERIIRAKDPFSVPELVTKSEITTNRANAIAMNYLTDSGYTLVSESSEHKTTE